MSEANRTPLTTYPLSTDLLAAPMAGISSPPVRRLLADYFDGVCYTEMISVEGLSRGMKASLEYLDTLPGSNFTIAQLFGGNAESYPAAVEAAERYSPPDGYDINAGCPVRKVVSAGGGAALLKELSKLKAIINALRRATSKPISIKIRTGWDDKTPVYREIWKIACGEGADALILHGRTRAQMFLGAVNYEAIAELAADSPIPVIGNGDVNSPENLAKMRATGVLGVMVGRGYMYAPWIFKALKEGREPQGYLGERELLNILKRLHSLMAEHAGENTLKYRHYLNTLKKFAVWFSKGLSGAAVFRGAVFKSGGEGELWELLEKFYGG